MTDLNGETVTRGACGRCGGSGLIAKGLPSNSPERCPECCPHNEFHLRRATAEIGPRMVCRDCGAES